MSFRPRDAAPAPSPAPPPKYLVPDEEKEPVRDAVTDQPEGELENYEPSSASGGPATDGEGNSALTPLFQAKR